MSTIRVDQEEIDAIIKRHAMVVRKLMRPASAGQLVKNAKASRNRIETILRLDRISKGEAKRLVFLNDVHGYSKVVEVTQEEYQTLCTGLPSWYYNEDGVVDRPVDSAEIEDVKLYRDLWQRDSLIPEVDLSIVST